MFCNVFLSIRCLSRFLDFIFTLSCLILVNSWTGNNRLFFFPACEDESGCTRSRDLDLSVPLMGFLNVWFLRHLYGRTFTLDHHHPRQHPLEREQVEARAVSRSHSGSRCLVKGSSFFLASPVSFFFVDTWQEMPNARRWQQSGASRMVQTRGVAAASVVARVARASTSFSRVAPCRCPADASARATTTVSPSTRCAVRKAEAEGAECSRPWFSEPRRDCDRGADAGVEVGGCHRGFGRGRSSSAPSQGIVASGPVAGEGSSRGGSHRRDKALHREVKEARWRIARGSQSGAVKSCRRLRPSWLRWRMPFAMESCGCRH